MHLRKVVLLAALGVAGAFVACTLNPQPLPPSDSEATNFGDDASTRSDSGSFTGPETPGQDAAAPVPNDNDGGVGGGGDGGDGGSDAGDGGDAGDASDSG